MSSRSPTCTETGPLVAPAGTLTVRRARSGETARTGAGSRTPPLPVKVTLLLPASASKLSPTTSTVSPTATEGGLKYEMVKGFLASTKEPRSGAETSSRIERTGSWSRASDASTSSVACLRAAMVMPVLALCVKVSGSSATCRLEMRSMSGTACPAPVRRPATMLRAVVAGVTITPAPGAVAAELQLPER
ncbi:hypothetical protein D3C86_963480 [compost metagenome]